MPEPPPDSDTYEGWTEYQLVNQVTRHAEAAGRGALAELTRRHMEALRTSASRIEKLTWALIAVTILLVFLTVALVVLTMRLNG